MHGQLTDGRLRVMFLQRVVHRSFGVAFQHAFPNRRFEFASYVGGIGSIFDLDREKSIELPTFFPSRYERVLSKSEAFLCRD